MKEQRKKLRRMFDNARGAGQAKSYIGVREIRREKGADISPDVGSKPRTGADALWQFLLATFATGH
jgi:hypothetical protein